MVVNVVCRTLPLLFHGSMHFWKMSTNWGWLHRRHKMSVGGIKDERVSKPFHFDESYFTWSKSSFFSRESNRSL